MIPMSKPVKPPPAVAGRKEDVIWSLATTWPSSPRTTTTASRTPTRFCASSSLSTVSAW